MNNTEIYGNLAEIAELSFKSSANGRIANRFQVDI